MDNSRDKDLAALHQRFHDLRLPASIRERAYRTFQKIQAQISDPVLTKMRHDLVNASRIGDLKGVEYLEEKLNEYTLRHRLS